MNMNLTYQQILQMFHQGRPRAIEKLMSINLAKCPSMEEQMGDLNSELKHIFYTVFTKSESKQVNLKDILPFKQCKTPMPVCNKLFTSNEVVYRCYQCTTHEAAVLCLSCFERGNHKGHRFSKMESGGGNCDCGNPDAIAPQGFCIDHKGTADQMIISEQEDNNFSCYFRQIFIWILKLYKLELKKQAQNLLMHIVDFLDWLNNESLFYNTLTNKLLFSGQNQMIDHILILGSASKESPLAKKATELFLKMFSLQVFKENMAIAYLRAYNRINNFESTKFQSLFIQLFANNDLVEKIITKSGLSLDPRERQYNINSYYNSLFFMGTIKQRAARIFLIPIIERGGIDCRFMQDIETQCQSGNRSINQLYTQNLNSENSYYTVNKILIKLIQKDRRLLQKQIKNQYNLIMKYSYCKNRVVLANPRVFVMLIFIYCQCDLQNIDMEKITNILQIPKVAMRKLLIKLTECFFSCLKEYGKCIGNSGFPMNGFQNYLNLYCRGGNIVINLDMLGIKFCAVALQKFNQSSVFDQTVLAMVKEGRQKFDEKQIWQSEDEEEEEEQSEQNLTSKDKQSNVVFYLGWLNYISFMIQVVLYEKAQVSLGSDLQVKDNNFLLQMQERQLKKLLLNARQLSIHQMQAIKLYWYGNKDINKEFMNKYTVFDKSKKKFVVKEDVKGIPIKRQLLKSLVKSPDYYLKQSDQMAMEINDKVRRFRQLLLSPTLLKNIYKCLLSHLQLHLKDQLEKYLKELAGQLKIINMLFQYDNDVIEDIIDSVLAVAQSNQKLRVQITSMFQEQKKQSMQEQLDKQKNQKRKQLLKRKKEEKLKQIKNKANVQQFLQKHQPQENAKQVESCIICHERNSQSPLYYMASTFLSNILYSILKVDGINPFFLSCFHQVHYQCYISITKEQQRTTCPLCKAFTNILIPTEQNISKPKVLQTAFERLSVMFAIQYKKCKKEYQNLNIEVMKSFIQLFFSQAIQDGLITPLQIKLFKILFHSVKAQFDKLPAQQKDSFCFNLLKVSLKYEKQSNTSYNLGLLIDFVFEISAKKLKGEQITQQFMNQLIQHCREIPRNDISKLYSLACKIFDLDSTIDITNESLMQEQGKQLKQFIHIFDPPKTIRSLLQQRKSVQGQDICKPGHNICICLICGWKGCLDCGKCDNHTKQDHNEDAIYFNFLTGGFHHLYNKIVINTRSFYVNQLAIPWKPSAKDDNYFFDIDMYKKMVKALKSGNLIQMIRNNYEEITVQRSSSIWGI